MRKWISMLIGLVVVILSGLFLQLAEVEEVARKRVVFLYSLQIHQQMSILLCL
ncbi:MAG: hypothetical protein P3W89_007170 [Aquificaceae bacterium]|nr:hypothetical protein [Aquificaceae bacterium]